MLVDISGICSTRSKGTRENSSRCSWARAHTKIANRNIRRVKQQRAWLTECCTNQNRAVEIQIIFAGDFYKTAIPTLRTTFRFYRAVKARGVIRPNNHRAGIALRTGTCAYICALIDIGHMRARNALRIAALIITADINLAAAMHPGRIHMRAVHDAHFICEHFDRAAFIAAAHVARCIQCTGNCCDTTAGMIAIHRNIFCFHHTRNIDEAIHHLRSICCGEQHGATCRINRAAMLNKLFTHRTFNSNGKQSIAIHIERKNIARGERHFAAARNNHAVIFHLRCHECGNARIAHADRAFIQNRRVRIAGNGKIKLPVHEIGVGNIGRTRNQSAYVNFCAATKNDSVWIYEKNISVCFQRTENAGRIFTQHAIEHPRIRIRLEKLRCLIRRNIKTAPIDHGGIRLLMHMQRFVLGTNGRAARAHLTVFRIRKSINRASGQ